MKKNNVKCELCKDFFNKSFYNHAKSMKHLNALLKKINDDNGILVSQNFIKNQIITHLFVQDYHFILKQLMKINSNSKCQK